MYFFGIFLLLSPLRLAGTEGLFGHSSFLKGHHSSPKGSSNPTHLTLAWTGYVIVLGGQNVIFVARNWFAVLNNPGHLQCRSRTHR
jgi:hypothetical protein